MWAETCSELNNKNICLYDGKPSIFIYEQHTGLLPVKDANNVIQLCHCNIFLHHISYVRRPKYKNSVVF
jgi:aminoglycoside phosphotransferase family enzyme